MGDRGALCRDSISRNDGGRVPGNRNNNALLGRSRGFPAQAGVPNIRRQPHTQPCCLALGAQFKGKAPPPIPLKIITLPHPTPILFHPGLQTLACVTTYAPAMDCHQPHPLLMQTRQSPHQSQETLMSSSLPLFNTTPYTSYFFLFFILLLFFLLFNPWVTYN